MTQTLGGCDVTQTPGACDMTQSVGDSNMTQSLDATQSTDGDASSMVRSITESRDLFNKILFNGIDTVNGSTLVNKQ